MYVGAASGLLESPDPGIYYGIDGMGDANYPEAPPLNLLQRKAAAVFLADTVNEYPGNF